MCRRASLRESLRLRPDVLRRLGWHYLRVHSFELFADPDAVAGRIADAHRAGRAGRRHRAHHAADAGLTSARSRLDG